MDNPDRRMILIGSGAAMALAAAPAESQSRTMPIDEDWNHGDNPWRGHPGSAVFRPKMVCILHMELLAGFNIRARRLHYPIAENGTANTWAAIRSSAVTWIEALNDGEVTEDRPNKLYLFHGMRDFVFGQPHHVIIYIKNENIEYPDRPIWFGKRLNGTVLDLCMNPQTGNAKENHSFFNSTVVHDLTELGNSVSNKAIYFENHHHKRVFLGGHKPIETLEQRVYSLKINVISQSITGNPAYDSVVPIIIDPDTGNMGGGIPNHCYEAAARSGRVIP